MKQRRQRWISLISLVLILVPMLVLTAYAAVYESSPRVSYSFTFAGVDTTKTVDATKTDVGESTGGYAGVSITAGHFGATGRVRFWVNNADGFSVTNKTAYYNSLVSNVTMPYTSDDGLYDDCTVKMHCQATGGVTGVGGYFQP